MRSISIVLRLPKSKVRVGELGSLIGIPSTKTLVARRPGWQEDAGDCPRAAVLRQVQARSGLQQVAEMAAGS